MRKSVIQNLEEHAQMIQTLELCKVYIIVNGEVYNGEKPITLPVISPMEGGEKPRIVQIPKVLKDPISEEKVSTIVNDCQGTLILKTSAVSMRYSRKNRHNIVYKAISGYIGYVSVSELDIQSPFRDRIYGECDLDTLEDYKQNERARLANSPLTRAVEAFISSEIQTYAKEFEAQERKRYDQEEKSAISKINEALDRWKNRFLSEFMRGLWGEGEGRNPPPPPLPTGVPIRIELSLSHQKAGIGVSLRLSLKFFDNEGRRVRPIPYKWITEDSNIAMIDEDLMIINTFSYGEAAIYAETLKGKLRSNKVILEIVRINEIDILPNQIEVAAGGRQKLDAVCTLANGEKTTAVYLVWTEDNPQVARVSSSGLVFGCMPGETKVLAGDDKCEAKSPAVIKVVPGQGQGQGKGKNRGRGYPTVLVSGEIDRDPDSNEYVYFSHEDPPVYQRVQDVERNIWWINSSAPLAKLYLDATKGYGYQSREWRMYHIERFIDIIVQIAFTQGPVEKESLSANDWIMKWGSQVAEIQAAAVSDLTEFIAFGETPVI